MPFNHLKTSVRYINYCRFIAEKSSHPIVYVERESMKGFLNVYNKSFSVSSKDFHLDPTVWQAQYCHFQIISDTLIPILIRYSLKHPKSNAFCFLGWSKKSKLGILDPSESGFKPTVLVVWVSDSVCQPKKKKNPIECFKMRKYVNIT